MAEYEMKETKNHQKDAISQSSTNTNQNEDTETDEKLTFRERRQQQLHQIHAIESNNADLLSVQKEHEVLPGAYQSGNLDGVALFDGSIIVGDPVKDDQSRQNYLLNQQKYAAQEEEPDIFAALAGATITEAILVEDDKDEKLDEEQRREQIRQEIMQQAATAQVVNSPTNSNINANDDNSSACNIWYCLGVCLCCECWLRCFGMCLEAMES